MNSQIRQGSVDHGRRIDLLYMQWTPVWRITVFGPGIGILNDSRSNIALLSFAVEINGQRANEGKKEDQYAELLQITQNTEFSHTSFSLSERNMPRKTRVYAAKRINAA